MAVPFKHQSASYRNKNGKRFECWEDAPSREEAKAAVEGIREQGNAAFYEKQDGGAYYRVYVEVLPTE
jgi:hypothetical protein